MYFFIKTKLVNACFTDVASPPAFAGSRIDQNIQKVCDHVNQLSDKKNRIRLPIQYDGSSYDDWAKTSGNGDPNCQRGYQGNMDWIVQKDERAAAYKVLVKKYEALPTTYDSYVDWSEKGREGYNHYLSFKAHELDKYKREPEKLKQKTNEWKLAEDFHLGCNVGSATSIRKLNDAQRTELHTKSDERRAEDNQIVDHIRAEKEAKVKEKKMKNVMNWFDRLRKNSDN